MQRSYSAILGIELSSFGKLFNTKAVISFRKEYEREEDKKIQSYSKKGGNSDTDTRDAFIQDARYEMIDEQIETDNRKLLHAQETGNAQHSTPAKTGNKYLDTYLLTQHTAYPVRGLNLDFRV